MNIGSLLGSLAGSGVSEVAKGVGDAIDKIFTSDDERLSHQEILERLRQRPDELQVELNKIDAQSKNIFQSGWRPFIGWLCGLGVGYCYFIGPLLHQIFGLQAADVSAGQLLTLLLALLGMSSTRTYEKMKHINK